MDYTRITIPKALAIISSLAFVVVCSLAITQPSAYAQQQQSIIAKLTGKNEVPPVNTQATGTAQFQLSSDGKELTMIYLP